MAFKKSTELQTIAVAYKEIYAGAKDPWIPVGEFVHAFFGHHPNRREDLLQDPITLPKDATPEQRQWAALCAAAVEFLSEKYHLPRPSWVDDPSYTLETEWYASPWAHKAFVREQLRHDTPRQFAHRNVFCGNRVFLNPHEPLLAQRKSA